MKITSIFVALALVLLPAVDAGKGGKGSSSSSSSSSGGKRRGGRGGGDTITLRITNLAFMQPLSPFFVMTHNDEISPLFEIGEPASDPLAILAEDGSPADLVELFTGQDGAGEVFAFADGFPLFDRTFDIEVPVSRRYPYITIASMAINTNDAFVAINGEPIKRGDVFYLPGLDAGSEENNENCNSIPGPACAMDSGNERSGNGEGVVHVHRGFHGVGDLEEEEYDWRNPMVRVKVM